MMIALIRSAKQGLGAAHAPRASSGTPPVLRTLGALAAGGAFMAALAVACARLADLSWLSGRRRGSPLRRNRRGRPGPHRALPSPRALRRGKRGDAGARRDQLRPRRDAGGPGAHRRAGHARGRDLARGDDLRRASRCSPFRSTGSTATSPAASRSNRASARASTWRWTASCSRCSPSPPTASTRRAPGVLLIGATYYLFLVARTALPWLDRPLPASFRRKAVCVVQGASLVVLLLPFVVPPTSWAIAAAALAALAYSFGVDIVALWRASATCRAAAGTEVRAPGRLSGSRSRSARNRNIADRETRSMRPTGRQRGNRAPPTAPLAHAPTGRSK